MAQREELTRFLKSARARLAPTDVGLPAGERRRTSGLRREEVATLAGMSVTWYTWFEQGRDVQLSAAMIERLGRALRLEPQEREFLFALAQHRPPPLVGHIDEVVRPSTQSLMDSLSIPALVIVEDWTVVGWNALVTRLFRDYAPLPREERNLFRILLLSPQYRLDADRYREMAKRLVARFKWDYSRTSQPQVFDALIAELREASEIFREYWEAADIRSHFEDVNSATLPDVGEIAFHHTSYAIEEVPGQRLILFAPADAASAEKLRRLVD
jgi:transcriptional regulator with XRE-family HTH domain